MPSSVLELSIVVYFIAVFAQLAAFSLLADRYDVRFSPTLIPVMLFPPMALVVIYLEVADRKKSHPSQKDSD